MDQNQPITPIRQFLLVISLLGFISPTIWAQPLGLPWDSTLSEDQSIYLNVLPPAGFDRIAGEDPQLTEWMRHLPLKPADAPVRLYNGQLKSYQGAHAAVLDIDVGKRDLQQCADAVMRLRAEYLFACGRFSEIQFHFTSGDLATYEAWRSGIRPVIQGNRVSWVKKAQYDDSYANFRKYLITIFSYAGTHSLAKELEAVPSDVPVEVGDVWIQGGFPGHAVVVIDVVEHPETGERRFLLAQSYMPAQDIHILRNPNSTDDSPWYSMPETMLSTPEWTFDATDRKRFGTIH
ncbi:DUF4846 domain-containing protein [Pontibacter sp. G13]|uniref:DUF4846 domain-containing protein n=1 Tax=Pontibacter sp. G13 TaxID=3074898 RepID=UPI00288C41ED|nr:DUF4846 domain-containing protein [Pontibacter sp. G13]WNJ16818.1 DUF4846 domain-containing protein [Pontibacter sp. G13]